MRLTTEKFIEKARKVHGDKYDYSKVNYINNHTKICIICPEHGEFYQTPNNHLTGYGCKECKKEKLRKYKSSNTIEFIEKVRKIHCDKYDYSKVEYINCETKVCIICHIHGEFWITPNCLLKGCGCALCYGNKRSNTNEFIEKAKEMHGDKYDYSKVEYINNHTKVLIKCPEHGEFWQTPKNHTNGQGCPKCGHIKRNKKNTSNTEKFIEKAKKIHGNKYDYSKVNYINKKTDIDIICKTHGVFQQKPCIHLDNCGCPICAKTNNVNETALYEFINSHISEKVVREKRLPWLGLKSLDIFIPKYNIAIEYQGKQHFKPLEFFGGEKSYKETVERDEMKYNLCKLNKTKLFYFSKEKDLPEKYFDKIYTNENELLSVINEIICQKF